MKGCIALYRQLFAGLAYLHGIDVVHADLKPGNICVNEYKELTIIDFGLAWVDRPFHRPRCEWEFDIKRIGQIPMQTLPYRAPEVCFSDPHCGKPMDVWSVGCIVLEVWVLRPVVRHDVKSAAAVIATHVTLRPLQGPALDYYMRLQSFSDKMLCKSMPKTLAQMFERNSVPPGLADLVCGMLEFHPKQRLKASDLRVRLASLESGGLAV